MSPLKAVTKDLSLAYFAMVMATGIVSLAAFTFGMTTFAIVLFVGNIAAFVVLVALTILRLAWFRRALLADLSDHQRGPGFFTLVAGLCVLGAQFVLIAGDYDVAAGLWGIATVLWIVFIYGIFAALST